jgi:hypothetical protein
VHLYILLAYNVSTKEVEWRRMEWNECHEHSVGKNLESDVIKPADYNHIIHLEGLRRFTKNIRKTYRTSEI